MSEAHKDEPELTNEELELFRRALRPHWKITKSEELSILSIESESLFMTSAELGFEVGDSVCNTPGGPTGTMYFDSEVVLVSRIRREDDKNVLWWACGKDGKLCSVLCGTPWNLNPKRTVWREYGFSDGASAYLWSEKEQRWVCRLP